MALPAVFSVARILASLICLLPLVLADSSLSSQTDSKPTNKRGISSLSGVPGVLYSQYSPHFQPVPVPHPFPVPVPQPVPIQVPKPFPVTVHKPVGLPVPVGVPIPVHVPVPRPYPVPVPLNLAQAGSSLGGAFGGSPFLGGSSLKGAFGGSSFLGDFGSGAFHPGMFGGSAPGASGSALGRLGYGLGVYSPGTPVLPVAPPGLGHSPSSSGAGLLHALAGGSSLTDPLAEVGHPPKY